MLVLLALFWGGCQFNPFSRYTYQVPEQINDGLTVGSLEEVHLDPVVIEKAVRNIQQGQYKGIHSILIYKDDKLVFEEYFGGHKFQYGVPGDQGKLITWCADSLHRVMSVTKSITSLCIGIAVDQGLIKSVHQSIFNYLPEYKSLNTDGKGNITIEHLLTMTSGLQGNEWLVPYNNPQNDVMQVYFSEDPVTTILSKPLQYQPGTIFQYYGGSNFLLGEILKHAAQMDMDTFAEKYLFEPLHISSHTWLQLNKGVIDGAGGLLITPRDMVKIGAAFLNQGLWNGKRIVSEAWVNQSETPYPGNRWVNNWDDHWGLKGYGYSWWTHTFVKSSKRIEMAYAAGWGGQYIMVIPALNTVVVFTGGNYGSYRPPFDMLKKYIIPAFMEQKKVQS